MATKQTKGPEGGVVGRLAERGEEAVSRLLDELGSNPRVAEALHRAASAKGKLDSASRGALHQVGLAPADELRELKQQVDRLEKRLAKLEAPSSSGKARTRRPATPKRRSTSVKKDAEKAASRSSGRTSGG
jgi:polyhydroxyalkanoate synthesis regulator phasin